MVFRLFSKTYFFPGEFTSSKIKNNYSDILNRLKIKHQVCDLIAGVLYLHDGNKVKFENNLNELKKDFKKNKVKKIITNCPHTIQILNDNFPKVKVDNIIDVIFSKINILVSDDKLSYNLIDREKLIEDKKPFISYHMPCLNKNGKVKAILNAIGFEVLPYEEVCCGSSLSKYDKDLATKLAKKRLMQSKTEDIVTTCPMCYKNLSKESNNVIDFSEVLISNV